MTDVISRPLRMPREDFEAVDQEVASGRFASADDLIRAAVEHWLKPVEIIEGGDLDALLGDEPARESYRDGPTVMRELIGRLEGAAGSR